MAWDHSRTGITVMAAFMVVIALASTGLRFWSRAVVLRGRYGLDDWLALAALFPVLALLIMGFWLLRLGVGYHQDDLSDSQKTNILLDFWIASFFFQLGLGLAKFSALAFYARIFGFRRYCTLTWTISFSVVIFITAGWLIESAVYNIFQCNPVQKVWLPATPGTCVPPPLLVTGTINVFTDIAIVLLPIPQILKLKIPWSRRFLIGGTLLVGYSIPLISVGRVVTIAGLAGQLEEDFTYALLPLGFWYLAEPTISLLAISLPGIFQLTKRGWQHGLRSLFTTQPLSPRHGGGETVEFCVTPDGLFHQYTITPLNLGQSRADIVSQIRAGTETGSNISHPHHRKVTDPSSDEVSLRGMCDLLPLEMIHVQTDIRVSYGDQPGREPAEHS